MKPRADERGLSIAGRGGDKSQFVFRTQTVFQHSQQTQARNILHTRGGDVKFRFEQWACHACLIIGWNCYFPYLPFVPFVW